MTKHRRPEPPSLSRRRAAQGQSQSRHDQSQSRREKEPRRQEAPPAPLDPPPFSRWIEARSLPAPGIEVRIEAAAAERAALAAFLDAPAVARLEGEYRLKPGSGGKVMVTGTARATVTRACVLTLEHFDEKVEEAVEVIFAPDPERAAAHKTLTAGRGGREEEVDLAALTAVDPPEPIVDGKVDLGALTAEFVALGLDPYPRKPGATFHGGDEDAGEAHPFAALGGLKGDAGEEGGGA